MASRLALLVAAAAVGAVAATAGASASVARPAAEPAYPDALTGSLKGDCSGGWEYHLSIGSVTWKRLPGEPYDVDMASGVTLSSTMADGTFWTLDSSKTITGKLLFSPPPSAPAFALVSVPATRHYPTGDTTSDDKGLGFGNTGTVTVDGAKGTLVVAFDRNSRRARSSRTASSPAARS
jgi:hypothetical protein